MESRLSLHVVGRPPRANLEYVCIGAVGFAFLACGAFSIANCRTGARVIASESIASRSASCFIAHCLVFIGCSIAPAHGILKYHDQLAALAHGCIGRGEALGSRAAIAHFCSERSIALRS